jgi:hypothetical protein
LVWQVFPTSRPVLIGGSRSAAQAVAAQIPAGGAPRYLLPDSEMYEEALKYMQAQGQA